MRLQRATRGQPPEQPRLTQPMPTLSPPDPAIAGAVARAGRVGSSDPHGTIQVVAIQVAALRGRLSPNAPGPWLEAEVRGHGLAQVLQRGADPSSSIDGPRLAQQQDRQGGQQQLATLANDPDGQPLEPAGHNPRFEDADQRVENDIRLAKGLQINCGSTAER